MESATGSQTTKRTQRLIVALFTLALVDCSLELAPFRPSGEQSVGQTVGNSVAQTPAQAPEQTLAPTAVPSASQTAIQTVAQVEKPVTSDNSSRVVLISIPDRKLAVLEGGNVIATFEVAVGAVKSPSPTGEFQIVSRVVNPIYNHGGKVVPSGKDNPVGTRWVGLDRKPYGIHGTNAPRSIGHAASHGCIRLRNRDMERLFTLLHVGDVVEIRGERDEQVAQVFGSGADDTTVAAAQVAGQE
jgi:lipoprotein-anchoring transpeptidase ErfK/SrfK